MSKLKIPKDPKASTDKQINIGGTVLSTDQIKKFKKLFRTLDHANRIKILVKIAQAGPAGIVVTEIYKDKKINLEQSYASILLAEMRKVDLVRSERKGKFVYYTINEETLKSIGVMTAGAA